MEETYDFGGWATRNNIRCSDGVTIRQDAFKDNNGKTVPLVWMHDHEDPTNVLGNCLLVNKEDGVYAYGKFNDSEYGQHAKKLVQHGDITSLSIYANHVKKDSKQNVMHGEIKEVSLVLAGANRGAVIDDVVVAHSDGEYDVINDEAEICFGNDLIDAVNDVKHSDETEDPNKEGKETKSMDNETTKNNDKTVADVYETLSDEQKKVVEYIVGVAVENAVNEAKNGENDNKEDETNVSHSDDEGEELMKHNVFDNEYNSDDRVTLSHDDMNDIFKEAKRLGSLKDALNEFTIEHADSYSIKNIDILFPDARTLTDSPEFIKRETGWVNTFMSATKKQPFSRIKSIFADITAAEARAKGYVKGNRKEEEVFTLLKRKTEPTTVYKKQKIDRDDVLDITDFDVVTYIKSEMRIMFDEEIARAALIGDGRSTASNDKISETNIRPIISDEDLYTVKVKVGETVTDYNELIKDIIRARKEYKGSGTPTFFTTEDVLTEMLLLEDKMGRPLYDSKDKLCTKLRVKDIVTVEAMEEDAYKKYVGVIVNPVDYTFGADKGGDMSFFDDFDINFNQMLYLYEGRCSGCLTKPYSALALIKEAKTAEAA